MLRHSRVRPGGGLRYAIARALLQVDAPPLESVADLCRTLHQRETPTDVLRELWTRASEVRPGSDIPVYHGTERRRNMPSASELRRDLRDADLRIYKLLMAGGTTPAPRRTDRVFRPGKARTVLVSVALALVMGSVISQRMPRGTPSGPNDLERTGVTPSGGQDVAGSTATPSMATPNDSNGPAASQADPATPSPLERDASVSTSAAGARARPRKPLVPTERPSLVRALDEGSMFSPSFATDGTALFFHTGRTADPQSALMRVQDPAASDSAADDLRVVTLVGDGARNYHARPSPDGAHIAFDSDRDGERGVYIAESDGTNVRRISGLGYAAVPAWSPDGDRLSFIREEPDRPKVWNLWLQDLSTGEHVRVTNFPFGQTWGASWFPDGRRICYSHEDRLFVHDLERGRFRQYRESYRGPSRADSCGLAGRSAGDLSGGEARRVAARSQR